MEDNKMSNSSFPLYDNLINSTEDISLSINEKKELISLINDLDQNGHETIYILIYKYMKDEGKQIHELSKSNNEEIIDVNFNLDQLESQLQRMIYKFTKMRLETIKEEKNREKTVEKVKSTI